MSVREWFALIAFASSVLFGSAGLVGMFRFPDPYSRMQAGGLCGTTAVFSAFIGALILAPNAAIAARVVVIMVFFLVSAPTGSYIVARFTWQSGTPVWKPLVKTKRLSRRKEPT
ncbi:MAG: cation:proton antiporter [Sphaerochaetaceae bacterium]